MNATISANLKLSFEKELNTKQSINLIQNIFDEKI